MIRTVEDLVQLLLSGKVFTEAKALDLPAVTLLAQPQLISDNCIRTW